MTDADGDPARLVDMIDAARKALRFCKGKSFEDFVADDLVKSAVERQIEIVGEACRKVSESLRLANPQIPWQAIYRTRNILAHDYGRVDYVILWRVLSDHLPPMIVQLETLIASFSATEREESDRPGDVTED